LTKPVAEWAELPTKTPATIPDTMNDFMDIDGFAVF
jgi:hypothetical protein